MKNAGQNISGPRGLPRGSDEGVDGTTAFGAPPKMSCDCRLIFGPCELGPGLTATRMYLCPELSAVPEFSRKTGLPLVATVAYFWAGLVGFVPYNLLKVLIDFILHGTGSHEVRGSNPLRSIG